MIHKRSIPQMPDGTPLSIRDYNELKAEGKNIRWVVSRKIIVILSVNYGIVSTCDVVNDFPDITFDELFEWLSIY
jgi:Protein of unknown function (DUF1153)